MQVCALNQEVSHFLKGLHMLDLTTQILMAPTHIMMEGKQLSSAMKMEPGVKNQLAQVRQEWNKYTGACQINNMARIFFHCIIFTLEQTEWQNWEQLQQTSFHCLNWTSNCSNWKAMFVCFAEISRLYIYIAETSRTQMQPDNVCTATMQTTTAIETEPEEDRNGQLVLFLAVWLFQFVSVSSLGIMLKNSDRKVL